MIETDFTSDEESKLLVYDAQNEGKQKYPKSVFFIVGNEFCERFSFYGMRTILTIYLTRILLFGDTEATTIYHAFVSACYFTPILGAILADSWLGKFRTIFYISIIYAIGNVTIATGAIPQSLTSMNTASMVGLAIIAIGTGGIKPCVSAFGGDQFEKGQELQLQRFFSFFYMSINLGSVISTYVTPILREDVHCFGEESCFSLAFGIPAILMITSLVIFLFGKPFYKIVPSQGNVVLKVVQCMCYAVANRSRSKAEKKSHWLDYADDKYDKKLISDIKVVLHVLMLYLPLPIFWALFDQQGSRWTLQATRMNGELFGTHIKPDQMQIINPFLIIVFIPMFDYIIYPILAKCNILKKPLQRITVGGLFAALSFVVAGIVELKLESTYPLLPMPGTSDLIIINNSPCIVKMNGMDIKEIGAFQEKTLQNVSLYEMHTWTFTPENCAYAKEQTTESFNITSTIESMMITVYDNKLKVLKVNDTKDKPENGESKIRFFFNSGYNFLRKSNASIKIVGRKEQLSVDPRNGEDSAYGISQYHDLPVGKYEIYLPVNQTHAEDKPIGEVTVQGGGTYIVSIYKPTTNNANATMNVFTVVNPNTVSILLQIPQYVLITAGEIMFSITGLEFSYSQAPKSMKAVLQAAWLLTVAFGNLIVVIVAEARLFEKISSELFMFAVLMALDMLIFAIMAYFYKYVNNRDSNDSIDISTTEKGKTNKAYEEETEFAK